MNSVQKANRLYNRHLSEEIKSKLINKSDSYAEMKQWLILNYGGVSRIINDVICELSRRNKPRQVCFLCPHIWGSAETGTSFKGRRDQYK